MARMKDFYKAEVAPALMKKFGYKTTMQVPRITKITLNMGVGEAVNDKKLVDAAVGDMTKIAGQQHGAKDRIPHNVLLLHMDFGYGFIVPYRRRVCNRRLVNTMQEMPPFLNRTVTGL